ncbi:hypothetical protein JWJ88_05765 [Paracoccus methylovorus]|uniref:Uncharacterized protein n=1 Tax=Paracoccus methylovorus TaxID=2812658 RepID=A0ABX7JEL5_9RHOB|nr:MULTISPECIES: hypothetical protein [Paracoccus]QRZ12154.1 hypothetical protein JWJ88_05765 [Paracoccus methylovorus]
MRAMSVREAMIEAAERERKAASAPERYRWIAVWWRLSALESQFPKQHRQYARGQMALAADIERRPQHYKTKPAGKTDWLRSTHPRDQKERI